MSSLFREARIDIAAITHNVATIVARMGVDVLAVVKANGYGHGSVAVANAALAGGATRLGVVDITEARQLREGGIEAPILAWLHDPDTDFREAADFGIRVGVSTPRQLDAAARAGVPAVHLNVDTGLGRNGAVESEWADLFAAAARYADEGAYSVEGIFSHLSGTSDEEDRQQGVRFSAAIDFAAQFGIDPPLRHLAATGGAWSLPELRFTMVRAGIGVYGLSPFGNRTSADLGLRPAMRLSAKVARVKRVAAGEGVSYGYLYRTRAETTLVLVPVGYADGIPRVLGAGAHVQIGGVLFPIAGRIAMDQFVVDVGDASVSAGDEVVLWGDPERGEPAVEEWADAAGTINYEVVTRLGNRPVRTYV